MKKLTLICVLAVLCLCLHAQQPALKPLSIGDTVPDITITNVYNYPASTIHLSDLKGKLVILDFWSTWCGSCIAAFPEMEKLQKEFSNQLQVVLVNVFPHDNAEKVQALFAKRKERTGDDLNLPYSLLQTAIAPYFPFKFIPHYVWIDKNRKIIAITTQDEATSENIKQALNGNVNGIHNKIDLMTFSMEKPLFVDGNGGNGDHFLYRSLLTKYIEGVGNGSGVEKNKDSKITRFFMLNTSPIAILAVAYPDELNCPANEIINESGNKIEVKPTSDSLYANSFCYDLIIPPSTIEEMRDYIKEDMKRYFGIKVITEKRKMKCLVLSKSDAINKIISRGSKADIDISETSIKKFMKNQPLSDLIHLLNNLPATRSIPVINETNISSNIDLELPKNFYELTIDSLKAFLKKAGFGVAEKEKEIKVSIITNK
ncbi:MAG TPA: TlpA disulfide reductase family protein [Hanamia sp.]|nr:TlpA disulfide reductase family protein [Hanamia sp.]